MLRPASPISRSVPTQGFRYGSAGQQTRSFDQDYRLTNVTDIGTVRRGLARVAENLSYAYYPTNNVQTITDAVTAGNSQSFGYDNLQRLSAASGGYGSFGFTYDGDGNQLSQTLGATTTNYGYGSGSDLLATISVGGVITQAIGYTADGRIASLNPGIQAPGGQYITSLSYNQDARLSAVNAGSGALASYTYDGFGQRLIKTVSGSYGEIYQYGQDGMLLEETNASGVAQADYIYLNGRPVAVLNGSTLYYLHDDTLGTPQPATDSNHGDWVVIRQQEDAENGEIVAAMIEGEATVKTLKQSDGHVWLMPHNPAFTPILGDDATILGKVVAVLRRV